MNISLSTRFTSLLAISLSLLAGGCSHHPAPRPAHEPTAYEKPVAAQKKVGHSRYTAEGVVIPPLFVEPYGNTGSRFSIRNVSIEDQGSVVERRAGGPVGVSFELLHDCPACGNAVNQVIVGLAGEERAQVSVWNGKQRSGGGVRVVNPGSRLSALAEDNTNAAQWVRVRFQLTIPDRPGNYYIRARYAQDHQGNLMTEQGAQVAQPVFPNPLNWWKVDRPQGPDAHANIGVVTVRGAPSQAGVVKRAL